MNYLTSTRSQIFGVTPLDSVSIIPQWMPLLHATPDPMIRPNSSYMAMASLRLSVLCIHQPQYSTPITITLNQHLHDTLLLLRRLCPRTLHRPVLSTNPITEAHINHQLILSTALVPLVAEYRCSMVCFSSNLHLILFIHRTLFIARLSYHEKMNLGCTL